MPTSLPTSTNPFKPGFGSAPPLLAGREALLHELLAGLYGGPSRPEFFQVLVGLRGVGKTVVLNEVLRHGQREERWLELRWTPPRRLRDAVVGEAPELRSAMKSMLRRRLRSVGTDVTLKAAPGGIGGEVRVGGRDESATFSTDAYTMLYELAREAAQRHRTIVLLVDEFHAAHPADLQELAIALQDLAVGRGLPLALLGAGLPSTERTIRAAGATFFARQRLSPVRNLSEADTIEAIAVPFEEVGRQVDDEALMFLAAQTGGYPYAVQLAGQEVWRVADGADVTLAHAREAMPRASAQLASQLFESAWQMIRPADQAYVTQVARLSRQGQGVSTAEIARRLRRSPSGLSPTRDRLIHDVQVLESAGRGLVQFTIPGFGEWVLARPKAQRLRP